MRKKNLAIAIIFVALVMGLFGLSKYLSPNKAKIVSWKSSGVDCLPNGHANLSQHIHQSIRVIINDSDVPIPPDIGVVPDCLAEIHTHQGEGSEIHVETVAPDKEYKLKDFFAVWGESFDRPQFERTVVVNSATSTEGGELILKDKQSIEVIYVGR